MNKVKADKQFTAGSVDVVNSFFKFDVLPARVSKFSRKTFTMTFADTTLNARLERVSNSCPECATKCTLIWRQFPAPIQVVQEAYHMTCWRKTEVPKRNWS